MTSVTYSEGADRRFYDITVDNAVSADSIGVVDIVTDSVIANTTLDVTGATTLNSTLGVTGAATLSSTLDVTGATTLSSTLDVTGASTGTGVWTELYNNSSVSGLSISLPISTTYNYYKLVFQNVYGDSLDNIIANVTVSGTRQTGASDYMYLYKFLDNGSNDATVSDVSASEFQLSSSTIDTVLTDVGLNGEVNIYCQNDGSTRPSFHYDLVFWDGGEYEWMRGVAYYKSATAIDGLDLHWAGSSDFDGGKIAFYGMKA
jgi:hypothetical protein